MCMYFTEGYFIYETSNYLPREIHAVKPVTWDVCEIMLCIKLIMLCIKLIML